MPRVTHPREDEPIRLVLNKDGTIFRTRAERSATGP